MKIRVLAVLVSLAVLTLQVPARGGQRSSADEPLFRVRIVVANVAEVKASLEISGYDVLEASSNDSAIELVVSASELRALESSGFSVVTIEQSRPFQSGQSKALGSAAVPGGTTAAVPASYRNLAGVYTRMQEIANAHPTIARFVDLTVEYQTPPTFDGRHLFALKISDNVNVDEDEPAMLIVGTHHAREINVPVIGLEAANSLTSRYTTDSRIAAAVNDNEIWIAPVWNPDGYNWVFTVNNMWRKNRRTLTGAVGVDQNRNYPQGWSTSCAGSTSPASDTYKGPSPASEPETQTMMAWSRVERFAKVIDYHSSGREVLFAYRCLGHPFSSWMEQEATALSEVSGYGGLTREPSAEGEHYEWQLAQMGAYAFLIETGTEFQPPYQSALDEAALVWPGILKVLERPISMSGHVTDLATGAPLAAKIEILNVAFTQGETNFSGGPRGTYHMFVPPGTYDVRFSAPGYSPVVSHVTVTASSSTVRDIQLSPEMVVFSDDFETNRGWTTNPNGTDTAITGQWERGDPETTNSAGTKQLGTTVSGTNDLVTGRLAGASATSFDIDNGSTSIQSPPIALPSGGNLTLTFSYYLAHTSTSSTADYLRVTIVGATTAVVLQELGAANNDDAAWSAASVNLSAFAGQTIRIRVDAADSAASIVEAGIDDVRVTRANDGPVAVDDTATTAENTTATIAVLANDSDPNGDPLSVTAITQGAHGAVTLVSGVVRYAPAPDYVGPDSFTYTIRDSTGVTDTGTVTVTVTPVNDAPVAVDDTATVSEDSAGTTGNVLDNDTDVDPGTTLTVTLGASPSNGTVTLAPNGTFTYTPAPDFNGTDSFTYTASDGTAASNVATVTIAVTAVNDAPVAVTDTASTTEDAAVSGAVLANDLDVEPGTTLTATLGASPAHGAVALASNGTFTYTPNANFNGTDSFTYTASDGTAVSNVATVTIAVTAVNDAPVAVNDTASTTEDAAVSGTVLGNDTDVDTGTTLTATLGASPAHGAVTLASNGTFTYTPNANFNGTDSFTYTASDGNGGAATGTVTVTVTPVNDAPVAVNDTATVTEDSAGVSGNVLGNDTDVDPGTTLTVTLGASPPNGTVTLAPDGTFTYTPAPDFNGTDSFTYTASDGTAVSNVATVTIAVTAVNDAPVAVTDTASTTEETAVSGAVLANDLDAEPGTTLTATLDAGPANGTVTLASNGTFTYTPAVNFSGTDSFTYTASDGTAVSNVATVTITVTAVNDAPVAVNDTATVTEDSAGVSGNVLGNDTDVDPGTTLTVTLGASPSNGTVTLAPNGTFTYTPAPDFNGTDSFTYTAGDGTAVSNLATVTIAVTAVNDAPVALNDTATVTEDSAGVSGNVLANDLDVEPGTTLTATLDAGPSNGTVALAPNGTFTYTPAVNFSGTDSFTYTASDGTAVSNVATVTIAVTAVNDAPVAVNDTASTTEDAAVSGTVLGNDTDVDPGTTLTVTLGASPSNGTVTLAADGTFTYTPAPDFNGTDSFTYTASDGTAVSNVATVTIAVTAVNDAPVALHDTATVTEDSAGVSGNVLGNDTDVDPGTTLTVTLGASPSNGTVTLAPNGTFTYTPAPDFNGTDSFTYTASDGTAVSNVATVTIAVTAVNDAPVALNDTATVAEDSAGVSGNVLANDLDVEPGTTLTATLDAGPANGTVALAANGTFTYTPAVNFNGTDSFTYTASDGTAVSNVATVTIAVTAVNDAPVAVNDTASTTEGTAVSGTVLGNDTDVDTGTTLTATLGASPAHGAVTLASNGSFTYTPAATFSGTDSFTYTASDGTAVSNVATVTITVTAVNDAPVAVNDTATVTEDSAGVSGNVLGNDTDADAGTTLTATLAASPANGTVTLAPNGTFTYTPAPDFNGTDSFTYTASDGTAVSNVATVTIAVTAVNDAPIAINDTATVTEDSAGVSGNVLANDLDVEPGTTLTATLDAGPANGTVTLAANGTFTYTPAVNFSGTDSFTYTASDGTAVSNVATVTIAVTAVNDAPVAVNDTASTTEGTAVSGTVLGNDTDVDTGTTLTATLGASPAHGAVTLASNGSFTYTPAATFSGTDSFTYTASDGTAVSNVATVTITVTAVNDAPVAVNDTATVTEDSAGVSGNVLGNDTDADAGTTLTATLAASPANGTVTLAPNGTFTYTPAPDFNGTDSFTYTASDGTAVSNVATVTIAVTAVNDAPIAINDTATVTEDSAGVSGNVLANDLDVEPGTTLTATLDAGPANGTVTLAANGTFTYTPAVNFSGTDSFTYTASDGTAVSNVATVTIAVTAVNDAPVAVNDTASTTEETAVSGTVLGNDTDADAGTTLTATLAASPAHGAVTLASNGSFTYTPAATFSGTDSFTYTASDGTAVSNVATVTITVTAVNDAPVAVNDTATVTEDSAGVSGNVLGNDTDADAGTTLTATLAASPANGTVTLAANGSFTYTPAVNFNGTDTFTYTASDGTAVSNVATVTITVTAVNDAPVAANDTASTAQGTAVSGTVLGNDTDVDTGTTLTASLGAGPANGTVTLALNGSFTYTPAASFSGTDSFTYTASDGTAASNVATVTITVTPVSNPVVFFDDFETARGWATNPNGTDTAITGQWERGNPESTTETGPKQLGTTVSGVNGLVTGRLAGTSVGSFDIDNGSTSIQSPAIVLPSGGNLTLTFSYYLAHLSNSSTADYLRVTIVGTTTAVVFQELGAADNDDAAWAAASVNLNAFAGQTIRIRIDAADAGTASLVEAAIDDVKIVRQ